VPTLNPPTDNSVSNTAYEVPPIWNRLMKYYPTRKRGKAIWQIPFQDPTTAAAYTFNQPYPWVDLDLVNKGNMFPDPPQPDPTTQTSTSDSNLKVQTIVEVFYGGHVYTITADQATGLSAFLTQQGYTPSDWIT
jgi:hypothetical protein